MSHLPVLVAEYLKFFSDKALSIFFEATVGAGGHARALLETHPEIKRYIGSDADPQALAMARRALEPWSDKVDLIQGNFSHLGEWLEERGIEQVDGFFLT